MYRDPLCSALPIECVSNALIATWRLSRKGRFRFCFPGTQHGHWRDGCREAGQTCRLTEKRAESYHSMFYHQHDVRVDVDGRAL